MSDEEEDQELSTPQARKKVADSAPKVQSNKPARKPSKFGGGSGAVRKTGSGVLGAAAVSTKKKGLASQKIEEDFDDFDAWDDGGVDEPEADLTVE